MSKCRNSGEGVLVDPAKLLLALAKAVLSFSMFPFHPCQLAHDSLKLKLNLTDTLQAIFTKQRAGVVATDDGGSGFVGPAMRFWLGGH